MQAGLEAEEAEILVESLLYADSRGVSSHGFSRLDVYTKRVERGVIAAGVNIKIIQESPASLALDGQNGVGAKIARQALELTMKKAREAGCCVTTVRNGNHFGAGSFYSKYAAEHGMIAIVASNSEAAVAPIGGAAAMLGTNPLAMAVPAACSAPFDLDMATSVSSRGKVVLAQKEGRSIPPDWAVDRNDVPTTDPGAVLDGGFMLPFGGVKGYSSCRQIVSLPSKENGGPYEPPPILRANMARSSISLQGTGTERIFRRPALRSANRLPPASHTEKAGKQGTGTRTRPAVSA